MKHLITGYTGFLGKNLVERIQKYEDSEIMFLNARDLGKSGFFVMQAKINEFKPDFIWNFAGEIYDDKQMIQANILNTQILLESTKDIPYKGFIHMGSSSEYGSKKEPMKTTDILEPRNMYEATKGAGTLLCQAHSKMYKKNIVVVRPFSVYGKWDKEHKFIPTLFRKFENKEPIDLYPGTHDFIYINDFILNLIYLKDFISNNNIGFQILNLGTGTQYTNMEVFEVMEDLFGYTVPLIRHKELMKSYDNNNWVMEIENRTIPLIPICHLKSLYEGLKLEYDERIHKNI